MRQGIERALTLVLALALLAALAGVVYVAMTPGSSSEPFTEFYVLGPNGTASDYPTNLSVGERGEVVVGVANHERETVAYTVVVEVEGESVERRRLTVADGERAERRFAITPSSPGEKRVRILLYESGEPAPSAPPDQFLRLVVSVSGGEAALRP